jgi:hypothetical protein
VRPIEVCCALVLGVAILPVTGFADTPRWSVEVKGGRLEPDIEHYGTYYGNDSTAYFALAAAWRINPWLETGGEIGYLNDSGVGVILPAGEAGAPVDYTLVPAHLYVTLRGVFAPNQLFVPYLSGGPTIAYYEQQIERQPSRSGRTDVGGNVRAGVGLLLDRVDPGTAAESGFLAHTYLFLEAQWFTARVDGIDLGGTAYLIGFRLEF